MPSKPKKNIFWKYKNFLYLFFLYRYQSIRCRTNKPFNSAINLTTFLHIDRSLIKFIVTPSGYSILQPTNQRQINWVFFLFFFCKTSGQVSCKRKNKRKEKKNQMSTTILLRPENHTITNQLAMTTLTHIYTNKSSFTPAVKRLPSKDPFQ